MPPASEDTKGTPPGHARKWSFRFGQRTNLAVPCRHSPGRPMFSSVWTRPSVRAHGFEEETLPESHAEKVGRIKEMIRTLIADGGW